MNRKQLEHITNRLNIVGKNNALWDVINGGMSSRQSEIKHQLPENTLSRNVRPVKALDDWAIEHSKLGDSK